MHLNYRHYYGSDFRRHRASGCLKDGNRVEDHRVYAGHLLKEHAAQRRNEGPLILSSAYKIEHARFPRRRLFRFSLDLRNFLGRVVSIASEDCHRQRGFRFSLVVLNIQNAFIKLVVFKIKKRDSHNISYKSLFSLIRSQKKNREKKDSAMPTHQ